MYYTVKEIAAGLSVDEEEVRRWLRSGKLNGTKTSNKIGYSVDEDSLKLFLEENPKYRARWNIAFKTPESEAYELRKLLEEYRAAAEKFIAMYERINEFVKKKEAEP